MEKSWLGVSLEELCDGKGAYSFSVSPVSPSKYHTVLYELPVDLKTPPKPHRNFTNHHWDDDHVKMPYSPKNYFLFKNENNEEILKSRWGTMIEAFSKTITSSYEFEAAVRSYQPILPKFDALHYLFNEVISEEESELFFKNMLPEIVNLAIKLPEILPGNLPILKKEQNHSISLSQLQIASLTANAFLCTFPHHKDASPLCPGFNFYRLFAANQRPKRVNCVSEKLKCIFHYFRRILSTTPCGIVTFERKHVRRNQVARWDRLENLLSTTKIHICSSGTIEDGSGCLQVDFANKFVGGGVLGYGCVQEEIRYIICPELIVSRLFTEELGMTEALVITGVERYSKYSGYGDTFAWSGNFEDNTPFDLYGRRKTTVVAIDAVKFNRPYDQFNSSLILRELNKAYVGFHSHCDNKLAPVATGNWGCGAFKGDPKLKFLIQLMACNVTHRNMVYYTFKDEELRDTIHKIYSFLTNHSVKIFELWRLLCRFTVAQEKQENFVSFIQKSYLEVKKQPSIKQFFTPIMFKNSKSEVKEKVGEASMKIPDAQATEPSVDEKMEIDVDTVKIDFGCDNDNEIDNDIVDAAPVENKEPKKSKIK
ncbi:poly(ADP-ribose) glycohydrolase-like [Onthophagus taurus]|uniref:poly(ADP-ribose) glycohydrolase-like n=1 Tax=Onthophagus taurus TaxID=166361 RepID=UPI0039BE6375